MTTPRKWEPFEVPNVWAILQKGLFIRSDREREDILDTVGEYPHWFDQPITFELVDGYMVRR